MHLSSLLLFPLNDLGFSKDQIILCQVESLATTGMRSEFRNEANVAFASAALATGKVEEVHIGFIQQGAPEQMLLELKGKTGFARLAYSNDLSGLHVRYIPITKFDDGALQTKWHSLNKDTTAVGKVLARFISDADDLTFTSTWGDSTFPTVLFKIVQVHIGAYTLEERKVENLPSMDISLEDLILSARSGALLAQSEQFLRLGSERTPPPVSYAQELTSRRNRVSSGTPDGATLLKQASASRTTLSRRRAPANKTVASVTTATEATAKAAATPESPRPAADPASVEQVEEESVHGLFRFPASTGDLDFNRTLLQGNTILELGVANETFARSSDALVKQGIDEITRAFVTANANGDRDAVNYIKTYLDSDLQRQFSVQAVLRRDSDSERSWDLRTVTPKLFLSRIPEEHRVRLDNEVEASISKMQMSPHLMPRAPIDHVLRIASGKELRAEVKDRAWKDDDFLGVMYPMVIAGSMYAKSLVLFAESGIRFATKGQTYKSIHYLPALRRQQIVLERQMEEKIKAAAGYADEGTSAALSQFAIGFRNISSHLDTTDYRVGFAAGRDEGARAVYDAFRSGLSKRFGIPELQDNASVEAVLDAVLGVAAKINSVVDELEATIRELRATLQDLRRTVERLEKELKETLDAWEGAGKAVKTLAYAGTGFLIGGPVGAGVGALVSIF